MAKCSRCGKKGLFLKVDPSTGLCSECIQNEQKMDDTIAEKKRELEEYTSKAEEARQSYESEQAKLDSLKKRIAKAKPIAKSILEANQLMSACDDEAITRIQNMELEELLPERDLNCMSMKDLRSQYNNLRKQISTVCGEYEKRYTVKTNAALYRLMVLGLEAAMDTILYKLQFGKKETAYNQVRELCLKYYAIAEQGNQTMANSLKRFIGQIESLYLQVIDVEYEYFVQRERAKEEQRALREQMRQEAEERKQLEAERKKVEKEEAKYLQEIERVKVDLANDPDTLEARIKELEALLHKLEEKKEEIINLQNGKAGTVYIISNIGSFGDDVFKIGMTRRLEPQDRVNELGNASVPFPFDVHSFIFSEDAPALETALHKEFNDRRVNKVNLRKEFFHVSAQELQAAVERIDPSAPFKLTVLAEQYMKSLSIEDVPEELLSVGDDEFDDDSSDYSIEQ